MRVLVTGAAGKVGLSVTRDLLENGHEIVALDKNPLPADLRVRCEEHYENITDRMALLRVACGCEAIVHLAALPNPHGANEETLTDINVTGTQYVLAAAEAHGIARVALASSCCVFGLVFAKHPIEPQYLPLDDDHPCLPQDLYGLSKLCNEETAAAYTRRCGMTTICLRLTAVMRLTSDAPPWFRRMFEYSNQMKSKDFWSYIDERDVARAFRLSIEAPIEGHHRLIIAARDSWTPYDIRDMAREHYAAASENVAQLAPDGSLYDTRRARETIGFEAQHSWRDIPEIKAIADEILEKQRQAQSENPSK